MALDPPSGADDAPSAPADGTDEPLTHTSPIPIASLNPDLESPTARSVRGIVSLIWPYSSSQRTLTLLLADPGFRLRRHRGQVRVQFHGASARAVARAGITSGDEILLGLEGGEYVQAAPNQTTPGRGIEWDLRFGPRLLLRHDRQAQVVSSLNINHPTPSPEPEVQDVTPLYSPEPLSVSRTLPSSDLEWNSPAFLKRARLSSGSTFESAYTFDPFSVKDEFPDARGSKRTKFGRASGQWRYTDRTPSPKKETPVVGTMDEEETSATIGIESSVLEDTTRATSLLPDTSPVGALDEVNAVPQEARVEEARERVAPTALHETVTVTTATSKTEIVDLENAVPPHQPLFPSMAPPPLPSIRTDNIMESTEEIVEIPDSTERPRTPEIRPAPSPGLPLVSPFPGQSAELGSYFEQSHTQVESHITSGAPQESRFGESAFGTSGGTQWNFALGRSSPAANVSGTQASPQSQLFGFPATASGFGGTQTVAAPESMFQFQETSTNQPIPFGSFSESFQTQRNEQDHNLAAVDSIASRFRVVRETTEESEKETLRETQVIDFATAMGAASGTGDQMFRRMSMPDHRSEPPEGGDHVEEPSPLPQEKVEDLYDVSDEEVSEEEVSEEDISEYEDQREEEEVEEESEERVSGEERVEEIIVEEVISTKREELPVLSSPVLGEQQAVEGAAEVASQAKEEVIEIIDISSGSESESPSLSSDEEEEEEEQEEREELEGEERIEREEEGVRDEINEQLPHYLTPASTEVPRPNVETDTTATTVEVISEPALVLKEDDSNRDTAQLITPQATQLTTSSSQPPSLTMEVKEQSLIVEEKEIDVSDITQPVEPPKTPKMPSIAERIRENRRISAARSSLQGTPTDVPPDLSPWFSARQSNGITTDAPEVETQQSNSEEVPVTPTKKQDGSQEEEEIEDTIVVSPSRLMKAQSKQVPDPQVFKAPIPSPLKQSVGLRTSLSYFAPLATLVTQFSSTLDVIALVAGSSPINRAKAGPRDHHMTLHLVDPSSSPNITSAQIFRPYSEALPLANRGDVILLRNFQVKSLNHQMSLVSGDESAWLTFRRSTTGKSALEEQVRGPPVEFGAEERAFARGLMDWWASLGEDGRTQIKSSFPSSSQGSRRRSSGNKRNGEMAQNGVAVNGMHLNIARNGGLDMLEGPSGLA